jgi:site-specific DNA recombinase
MLLGHQSEREVLRARMRTSHAMGTQARDQGRHLGGRPPYGYRLVDAGPHPNRDHARWGRRLHRLDPDPATAPHVRWIFTQRLAGASTASIARTLNDRGVPSPAALDPGRNRHRTGTCWTLRTVAAILENPRYTGRQVWNRQRTDHRETLPGNKQTSLGPVRVWNLKSNWVISTNRAHPALVTDTDFLAAQAVRATCSPRDDGERRYRLTGLLICRACGRRLQPHWVHGRAAYRCRHGHTSAHSASDRPRWIYWPEHRILTEALDQLTRGGQLVAHAGFDDLLAHLHGRDAVIICDTATVAIDDPTDDERTPQMPAPNPPEGQGEPTIPNQRRRNTGPATTRRSKSRTTPEPSAARRTPPRPSRNVNNFGGV